MKKILVVGESCQDIFTYGRCERLCPEAPVPVFVPNNSTPTPTLGMAGNVVRNLNSLEPNKEVEFVTNDAALIVKNRMVDEVSGQMILRIDHGESIKRIQMSQIYSLQERIINGAYEAVVISDYCRGFLSEIDISKIATATEVAGVPSFLDTKKVFGDWSRSVSFVKINRKEYLAAAKSLKSGYLPEEFCKDGFVVTDGKDGCTIYRYEKTGTGHCFEQQVNGFPAEIREVSGAGDTFLAAFVLEYLKNPKEKLSNILRVANLASSLVVTKRGVIALTKKELDANRNLL